MSAEQQRELDDARNAVELRETEIRRAEARRAQLASELETQVRCSLLLFAFCSLSILLFAHLFVSVRRRSTRRRSASC